MEAPFDAQLRVQVDGTTVKTHTEASQADAAYGQQFADLSPYANGAIHTISFKYTNGAQGLNSMLVDDVSLSTVPSPLTAVPTVSSTLPVSPSSSADPPRVFGSAEAGSTVTLYSNSTCSSAALGVGTAAEFVNDGIPATVPANAITTIFAQASQAGKSDSRCSATFVSYTQGNPQTVPETTLSKTPKKKVFTRKAKRSVAFAFASATPGATFQCSIDGKAFKTCTSGHKYKLKVGKHTFAVRALAAGLTDPTPATYSFKIKRKPSPDRAAWLLARNLRAPGLVGRTCGVPSLAWSESSRRGPSSRHSPPRRWPATRPSPGAAPAPKAGESYGNLWNILPPGSNGNVTALGVASLLGTTATPTNPPHFADQLEMYDALTTRDPGSIGLADIEQLYKREDFTPATVVSTKTPKSGVTIQRDGFGVPFITGTTFNDVEYGAGYAAIEDRMFLMDVLRHTGAARMAEFVGNTPGNVAMDQSQLRTAYYTPAEANAQIERAAADAGAYGQKLLGGVDAFLAGINQAQHDLCPIIAAPTCPAEYAALQKTPTDWTRADIVYIASLVGGIFGKGGGKEVANAKWWQALKAKFGKKQALRVYTDLREKNDPEAPATSSKRAPYDGVAFDPGKPGVALPDRGGATAPGSGTSLRGSAPRAGARVGAAAPGPARRRLGGPLRARCARDEQRAAGDRQGVGDREAAGRDGPADRLLHAAAAGRAGARRARHPGPRRRLRRHEPVRPARARHRLRVVRDLGRQRQHRHRRREALQHRRFQGDGELGRLPGRQEVRADAVRRAHRDHHAEPHRAGPRDDVQLPGAAHPARHRPAAHHRRRHARRPGGAAVDVRPRGGLGARLQPAQRPRLRAGREVVPAGGQPHRLHVQLVLRRLARHLLLLLGAAAQAVEEGRAGPAALGRARSTTGRAGCRSRSTPTRRTPSAATW